MHYRFVGLIFLLSLVTVPVLRAQENPQAPQFVFEESRHDFGDIKQGNKVSHTFHFTNNGKTPLIISKVITTCGCTAPEYPKDPVPPGGKGSIKITFDSTGKVGKQNKVITILSNAEDQKQRLTIMASVLP